MQGTRGELEAPPRMVGHDRVSTSGEFSLISPGTENPGQVIGRGSYEPIRCIGALFSRHGIPTIQSYDFSIRILSAQVITSPDSTKDVGITRHGQRLSDTVRSPHIDF
jgi:hypothetical protein